MSWFALLSSRRADEPVSHAAHPVAIGGGSPFERHCGVAMALLAMLTGVAVALF